ncbi:MAG: hypothetical protein AAFR67_16805, partial [Chloroflexota bacterium]
MILGINTSKRKLYHFLYYLGLFSTGEIGWLIGLLADNSHECVTAGTIEDAQLTSLAFHVSRLLD